MNNSRKTVAWVGAEVLAVTLSLLYTFLYINEQQSCFAFGIAGSLLFVLLTFNKRIYAESFLHVFYAAMGVFGFLNWGGSIVQTYYQPSTHAIAIAVCALLVVVLARLLPALTNSEEPWLDAFTTVFSLWATWMMVNFVTRELALLDRYRYCGSGALCEAKAVHRCAALRLVHRHGH